MDAAPKSQRDGNRFAVIRHYEPARIERELLAQVFEVVRHGAIANASEIDQEEATMIVGASQNVVDGLSCFGGASVDAVERDQLEPAA